MGLLVRTDDGPGQPSTTRPVPQRVTIYVVDTPVSAGRVGIFGPDGPDGQPRRVKPADRLLGYTCGVTVDQSNGDARRRLPRADLALLPERSDLAETASTRAGRTQVLTPRAAVAVSGCNVYTHLAELGQVVRDPEVDVAPSPPEPEGPPRQKRHWPRRVTNRTVTSTSTRATGLIFGPSGTLPRKRSEVRAAPSPRAWRTTQTNQHSTRPLTRNRSVIDSGQNPCLICRRQRGHPQRGPPSGDAQLRRLPGQFRRAYAAFASKRPRPAPAPRVTKGLPLRL